MRQKIKALLRKSPSLRKWFSFWYRHTKSTILFSSERGVNIDAAIDPISPDDMIWREQEGWTNKSSILNHVHVLWNTNQDYTGKKVALLAHWDKNNILDPYVIYYAKHLADCGFDVILTSGCPVVPRQDERNIFSAVIYRDCPGYDFTSWKAALEQFPALYHAQELFITNDSIFAPMGSYTSIFSDMENLDCDLWGFIQANGGPGRSFLHSYAILFKSKALRHDAFREFFDRIPLLGDRSIALQHEIRLTQWLAHHDLSVGTWLPASALPWPWFNSLHNAWRQMPGQGLPLIKRDIFLGRGDTSFPYAWPRVAEKYGYPKQLISNYLARIKANS